MKPWEKHHLCTHVSFAFEFISAKAPPQSARLVSTRLGSRKLAKCSAQSIGHKGPSDASYIYYLGFCLQRRSCASTSWTPAAAYSKPLQQRSSCILAILHCVSQICETMRVSGFFLPITSLFKSLMTFHFRKSGYWKFRKVPSVPSVPSVSTATQIQTQISI